MGYCSSMSWACGKELTHHTLSQTLPGQGVRVEFIPDRNFSGEQRIDVPSCVHIVSSLAVPDLTPWLMQKTLVCSPLLSIQPLTFCPLFSFPLSTLKIHLHPQFLPQVSPGGSSTHYSQGYGVQCARRGQERSLQPCYLGSSTHPTRPWSLSGLCLSFLI